MSYDIIGDIHGCSKTLENLLRKLGYAPDSDGIYTHPDRRVIFLGDFIDRGPFQREVLSIVRPMIDSGVAQSVMGNHEYNAIAFATPLGESGDKRLRVHSEKNLKQHREFLAEYQLDSDEHKEIIWWFKTLPLWLDLGDIRVIHACWDSAIIQRIGAPVLTDELLRASSTKDTFEHEAIETLLKGKEIPLPEGHVFHDKDGNARHDIRVRWWDKSATDYRAAYLGPEHARTDIPDEDIGGDHLIEYSHEEPPVFLGHYWMVGEPEPLAPNIACMDYSVARAGGKLAAYRWDGEAVLQRDNYVTVDRIEKENS